MTLAELLRRLLGLCAPYWRSGALIVVGLLLDAGLVALIPYSFRSLIDQGLIAGDHGLLATIVIGLAAGALLVSLTGLSCDWLYARVTARVLGDLRERMFTHLQRLSMAFHSGARSGDLIQRFSGDLAVVETALANAIPWGLLPGLNVVFSATLLFLLDWRLALVVMAILPPCLLGPRFLAGRAVQSSYDRQQQEGRSLNEVQENLAAQGVVKGFGLADFATSRFRRANAGLSRSMRRLLFFNSLIERSAGIGTVLLQVAVLGGGVWMASRSLISVGTLTAFQALLLSLSHALTYVLQYVPTLVHASGGMRHIDELLDEIQTVADAPDASMVPPMRDGLELSGVAFGYTAGRRDVDGVSLRIPRGHSVAFVGGSGSGKSTLLHLAMRFYDPQEGRVMIDGRDLRTVAQHSLRAQMGVVFQENFLFDASFADNIRMGRLDASREAIEAAAREAEIHDFIAAQPQGYDTFVGERGGRLSGGQRQRIAIARALLRDPALLLLDEATSALDPQTEGRLNETIERVGRGRTVLSVTHRLASVVHADCIHVMQDGRVMESGTHAQLLAVQGLYHGLWMKQSGFRVNAEGDQASVAPERLAGLPIFDQLDPLALSEAARRFVTEQHPADRTVIHEGDPGDRFYIVVRGRLAVSRQSGGAAPRRIAVLQDGDCFGEMALLRSEPRTASVISLVPCTLLSLPRAAFADLLHRAPGLSARLERLHARRQATLEESARP